MLAAPVDEVPAGPNLLYEPKWDGWRCLAFRGHDGVYLQSRAGRNLTLYFPDITRAVRTLPAGTVLDGELIVWDRGRTNFAQLQRRITAGRGVLQLASRHPTFYKPSVPVDARLDLLGTPAMRRAWAEVEDVELALDWDLNNDGFPTHEGDYVPEDYPGRLRMLAAMDALDASVREALGGSSALATRRKGWFRVLRAGA
ncbi:hypothetical protein [Micromonospora sp. NPDC023956]|uniref:ATP-dependent DNA ligase n=1 Tax=Micromonospora sp. NPDC023956 TaxID=3155722 RepID=UPI0033C641B0